MLSNSPRKLDDCARYLPYEYQAKSKSSCGAILQNENNDEQEYPCLSGVKDKEGDEGGDEGAGGGLEKYLSKEDFEKLFPHRNEGGKAAFKIYEYENLLSAAREYPLFANQGSEEIRRREVAAFLANIAQETTGGWDTAPGGRYYWGLYFLQEVRFYNYCIISACFQR